MGGVQRAAGGTGGCIYCSGRRSPIRSRMPTAPTAPSPTRPAKSRHLRRRCVRHLHSSGSTRSASVFAGTLYDGDLHLFLGVFGIAGRDVRLSSQTGVSDGATISENIALKLCFRFTVPGLWGAVRPSASEPQRQGIATNPRADGLRAPSTGLLMRDSGTPQGQRLPTSGHDLRKGSLTMVDRVELHSHCQFCFRYSG